MKVFIEVNETLRLRICLAQREDYENENMK